MFFLILLPLAFWGIFEKLQPWTKERGEALTLSLMLFEAIVLILANVLSIGKSLSSLTATLAWFFITILLFAPLGKREGTASSVLLEKLRDIGRQFAALPGKAAAYFRKFSLTEKILLTLSGILCLVLLFLALFNVPYNYDSMTYHLARIGYWIDNGSVSYYLTNIDRQLYSPVLSEYNLLFMYLLGGSDILLNLQQFVSMVMSAYLISVILERLGTGRVFRLFAILVYLSMPLTMSQAITTQNDLSAGLWYLIFVYEVIRFPDVAGEQTPASFKETLLSGARIGAAVGFAFLMKVSVCASMVWFLPWILILCIRKKVTFGKLAEAVGTATLTMLCVMAETLIRTYRATGALMSSATGDNIMVATKNVKYIVVNIMKNYSLLITQHFLTGLNGFVYRLAISAGRILGVEVNNIAISFHGFDFITYLNTGLDMYSHDRTSSAFAAYLALAGAVGLVIWLIAAGVGVLKCRLRKDSRDGIANEVQKNSDDSLTTGLQKTQKDNIANGMQKAVFHPGFVISSWLGFGFIMALLRWQPWGSRLMYPGLMMATVSAVYMLAQIFGGVGIPDTSGKEGEGKRKGEKGNDEGNRERKNGSDRAGNIALLALAALSILLAIKPLADNSHVALSYLSSGLNADRKQELMFTSHSSYYESYRQIIEKLKEVGAKDIALVISGDGYDYPLWKMLKDEIPEARLRHILADDTAMKTVEAEPGTPPDCILWIERGALEMGTDLDYFGATYTVGFLPKAEGTADAILFPNRAAARGEQLESGNE
ncbi:MAG: hypothetical protein K6E84_04585 [Lachnospiraceae bacterium]|nr:hypothetical protein [Lachnospiraceae bacterium]